MSTVEASAVIYALSDPRDGAVRYVGVTTQTLKARLRGHLRYRSRDHRTAWVQSLVAAGLEPVITALESVTLDERDAAEQRWIAFYRAQGANLTNSTRGGLGSPGYKHTNSARELMSQARKNRPYKKRPPISAEERERRRLAGIRQMEDPAMRAAVSQVHRGKTIGATQRLAVSQANARRWQEWRESGMTVGDETRARMSLAAKARPARTQSAETRALLSEQKRAWWAQRKAEANADT